MRTEHSPLIGTATPEEVVKLKQYAVAHAAKMTKDMTQGNPLRAAQLVEYYDGLCRKLGLDTVLVVCQTWHETTVWSSLWFDAPRRNPAGIGVSGRKSSVPLPGYQRMPNGKWMRGSAYDTYAIAALAHVWGVAMWCGLDTTPIADARYLRKMYTPPRKARGSVRTVAELGFAHNPKKIGWAYPGTEYGYRIAKLANDVIL